MIKLNASRFTDIMPENLAGQPETRAFAYALGCQIETLCAYADGLRIYAAIASMPEKILDILAVELRTPAYRQDFDIEVKRALVEGTLEFYAHMGTPAIGLSKLFFQRDISKNGMNTAGSRTTSGHLWDKTAVTSARNHWRNSAGCWQA